MPWARTSHNHGENVVEEFKIVTDHVTDISPIRVFDSLRVLECPGTQDPTNLRKNGQLADLTPLKGMNLAGLTQLNLGWTKVSDAGLDHFKGCKNLTALLLNHTQVTDVGLAHFKDCKELTGLDLAWTQVTAAGLAHFKDCKNLGFLGLSGTQVTDAGLAHFKNCKNMANLFFDHTKVTDLSLLKEMPLKELSCDFRPERDGEILRSIKTLETINGKPAAEFWKDVEKK